MSSARDREMSMIAWVIIVGLLCYLAHQGWAVATVPTD